MTHLRLGQNTKERDMAKKSKPKESETEAVNTTGFTIEDGIEIPPRNSPRGSKYPFAALEVGQSFLVTDVKIVSLRGAAWHAQKRNGHKYSVRAVEGGVRIWRRE